MKHKVTLLLLAALTISLAGCSLAREGGDGTSGQDRLIGALITTEYLDLFDMDAYMSDNLSRFVNSGGNIEIRDPGAHTQRLYADIKTSSGVDPQDWEVSFPGVDGLCFFAAKIPLNDTDSYWGTYFDEGLNAPRVDLNVTDSGEEVSLECAVYMTPDAGIEDRHIYVNPLYQTEKGDIYAVSGQGFFFDSGGIDEGEIYSETLRNETTLTRNGVSASRASSVTVRLFAAYPPVRIAVFHMDRENLVLRCDEYTPGAVPTVLDAAPGAEYLLIRTEKEIVGETAATHEIYENRSEDGSFSTFHEAKNGFLVGDSTTVRWHGSESFPDPNPPV